MNLYLFGDRFIRVSSNLSYVIEYGNVRIFERMDSVLEFVLRIFYCTIIGGDILKNQV